MAMGDSISAAFAAHPAASSSSSSAGRPQGERGHSLQSILPLEYRSLSFSGGVGTADGWTLPFFLRHYNTSLTGYSIGDTIIQTPSLGYLEEHHDQLNVALSNSHSWQLERQVEELIKQSKGIDNFGDRWKLLTILIGANDLCDGMPEEYGGLLAGCNGNSTSRTALADRYEQFLRAVLGKIRDSFAKIIVQLQPLFSLASVVKARQGEEWCSIVGFGRKALNECSCLDKDPTPAQLAALDATTQELNSRLTRLVGDFNLQRPDFGVIEQSAARGLEIPDHSFLSAFDCFHPSAKAQRLLSVAVWNGLFHRSEAPDPLNASIAPICPNANSVIKIGPAQQSRATPSREGSLFA